MKSILSLRIVERVCGHHKSKNRVRTAKREGVKHLLCFYSRTQQCTKKAANADSNKRLESPRDARRWTFKVHTPNETPKCVNFNCACASVELKATQNAWKCISGALNSGCCCCLLAASCMYRKMAGRSLLEEVPFQTQLNACQSVCFGVSETYRTTAHAYVNTVKYIHTHTCTQVNLF